MATIFVALATTIVTTTQLASVSVAAKIRHPVPKQLGMNTFVPYNCESPAQWSSWATTQVDAFKGLGANAIAFAFPMYTDSLTANTFYAKDVCNSIYQTPSPTELATLVQIAHHAGLQVFLRPLLYETNLYAEKPGAWRGTIHPADTKIWFENYWNTMMPYLQMAQANDVEHFAIYTELQSMALKKQWKSLIASAHKVYKGDLVFTTTWEPHVNDGVHWHGTSVGFDLYWGVPALKDTATPEQIVTGWNQALATTNKFPLISSATVSETGIVPQDGAYSEPYKWSLPLSSNHFNQAIQANWFTAACQFFKSHKMGGIYFWGSTIYDQNGALLSKPSSGVATISEIQPLTQQAIRTCFTGK
jgi:hypothetical protein